jgi:hypothetical protein
MKKVFLIFSLALLSTLSCGIYFFEFKNSKTPDSKTEKLLHEKKDLKLLDGPLVVQDKNNRAIHESNNRFDKKAAIKHKDPIPSPDAQKKASSHPVRSKAVHLPTENKPQKPDNLKKQEASSFKPSTPLKQEFTQKMTAIQIKSKYEPALIKIEHQAYKRLNHLIDLAKNEFLEKEANDRAGSYPYFYNKYSKAASNLEERTDHLFYAELKKMQQDLKENGFPETISNAYAQGYENRKEKLRSKLMKKAAGI